jgi:hypothetical protein
MSEGDWEDSQPPVDPAGIMILDVSSVVSQLRALTPLTPERAELFIGNDSASAVFARYEAAGNGLAALKTKYAGNKTAIIAKWNELAAWVAQHQHTP